MKKLKTWDIFALGFMTFALFLGAGNIIFPPMVGLAAGENLLGASTGFLLTGVGLPLLGVIALARVGGGLDTLTSPIGRIAGLVLAVAIYLTIGPLFATPRTATVSFEMGLAPFVGNTPAMLLAFTIAYFVAVALLSLFPGKLMDNVGKIITPVLILALAVLGGSAVLAPVDGYSVSTEAYASQAAAFSEGFLQGYQTMDALASLIFGIVIVNAIKAAGVSDSRLHTRYCIYAGIIAATCLGLVYVSLMYLGATNSQLAANASTGVQILTAFVQQTFGPAGLWLLATVIMLACLTTGVGLITACSSFFSELTGISYRTMVIGLSIFSTAVANQGLAQLIAVAVPVLVGLYPVAIALIALSLLHRWNQPALVYIPVMSTSLVFGLFDAARAAKLDFLVPAWLDMLPGAALGMGWVTPVVCVLVLAGLLDFALGNKRAAANATRA
ncbi:branched-chain amino acid transport system II carrier protein [Comamonas testosteroni]|jgi:LIVCS family branched-chain amino acid:cation transporter|uniref:Branched-chain amino acid transport system carrier protein n=2 Tax=Comamonas testosteroni TaxID=285 RepID=B7WT14_COMTK|nr:MULTISPECIES: branched-chain amino acid transport system II carrier protein [Comamonas]AIJ45154.1 branched-chain amino acid transporter [Comamonas testosteroni TK102]EED69175.1 branched-chain amino acid transport system II carrier protein [Comamonas testosteroni KF-1]MPS88331.1 branched-chain amino acid transport system II carrier protein [Comamonas sp.]TYK72526.1 branched-chain amino acid transport system II carrier protein [Comamonas sp. Z3]WQG67160.1 branched-chain amino acid transport s